MNPYRIVSRRLNFFERLTQASYSQLLLLWLCVNCAFTVAYFALNTLIPEHGPTIDPSLPAGVRLFESFYFSVVTATSTGYGDLLPQGFSKILAMIECIMALMVFAVLVGKLVSQRQDVTLHEVHRMTFEGVFYHIRHVLFIVRKDFDALIHKAHVHHTLEEHDWENLSTAYLQAHSLIEEIPDLYSGHGYDLHNIDLNREKLLFEAVHRTLTRIHILMNCMDAESINWRAHEASYRELRTLLDMVDAMMSLWKERSPYHEEQEFEEIRTLCTQLHRQMKERMHEKKA